MGNGTNGSHPPGNKFSVTCTGKAGLTVNFSGDLTGANFAKQEDADYFKVGTNYVVDFSRAHSGDTGGGD